MDLSRRKIEMIRNCNYCGREYKTTSPSSHYCSRKCQSELRLKESEAKRRRICQWCGKGFVMRFKSGKAYKGEVQEGLFCSRECRSLSMRDRERKNPLRCKVYFKKCIVCDKIFTARYKSTKYCSEQCCYEWFKQYARERHEANWIQPESFKCEECGKIVIPEYGSKRRVFCSINCSNKYQHRVRRQRERAKLNGAMTENVNAIAVFERDMWRCKLCGKKLNPKNKGTYKDVAPELDHIIPLSQGGEHSYKNTQCSCRKCNSEKGALMRGQLRLF